MLTVSSDCTAKLWGVESGACTRTFSGETNRGMRSAEFSPGGVRIEIDEARDGRHSVSMKGNKIDYTVCMFLLFAFQCQQCNVFQDLPPIRPARSSLVHTVVRSSLTKRPGIQLKRPRRAKVSEKRFGGRS